MLQDVQVSACYGLYSRNGTVMVYTTSRHAALNQFRCCGCILVVLIDFDSAEGGIPVGNGHTCPI